LNKTLTPRLWYTVLYHRIYTKYNI
jgi:hypothetical protein